MRYAGLSGSSSTASLPTGRANLRPVGSAVELSTCSRRPLLAVHTTRGSSGRRHPLPRRVRSRSWGRCRPALDTGRDAHRARRWRARTRQGPPRTAGRPVAGEFLRRCVVGVQRGRCVSVRVMASPSGRWPPGRRPTLVAPLSGSDATLRCRPAMPPRASSSPRGPRMVAVHRVSSSGLVPAESAGPDRDPKMPPEFGVHGARCGALPGGSGCLPPCASVRRPNWRSGRAAQSGDCRQLVQQRVPLECGTVGRPGSFIASASASSWSRSMSRRRYAEIAMGRTAECAASVRAPGSGELVYCNVAAGACQQQRQIAHALGVLELGTTRPKVQRPDLAVAAEDPPAAARCDPPGALVVAATDLPIPVHGPVGKCCSRLRRRRAARSKCTREIVGPAETSASRPRDVERNPRSPRRSLHGKQVAIRPERS